MFAIQERLFFSKLLLFFLLLLSLSIWFVFCFLWEKLREIISDNVADCVSTRNVFEKQENKKVKHTQHTKRGKTIQKLWSDFIFVCARRTASSVGAHYVNCLKVLYEIPFREALALLLLAHTEASGHSREGGNETLTSLLAGHLSPTTEEFSPTHRYA